MKPRFFTENSFWNQPIMEGTAVDPQSERMIAQLADRSRAGTGPLFLNMHQFTVPVYYVDDATPKRRVRQKRHEPAPEARAPEILEMRHALYNLHPEFGEEMPLPEGAVPDPMGDAHLCVVHTGTGEIWDMWSARVRDDGDVEAFCGIRYSNDWSGVWSVDEFPVKDNESIHYHGPSRAAGTPLPAGLILREELLDGRIEHKLAFACWNNQKQRFLPPACWTDGFGDFGIPEGAVLQLDPDLDLAGLNLCPAALTIARAMQEYGLVDVDNAKGNCLYAEGLYGKTGESWEGILAPNDLAAIPVNALRVLKLEGVIERGDDPGKLLEERRAQGL
ncbi:MAG: hypothetical protein ACLFVC_02160 [Opitutales bacterium]